MPESEKSKLECGLWALRRMAAGENAEAKAVVAHLDDLRATLMTAHELSDPRQWGRGVDPWRKLGRIHQMIGCVLGLVEAEVDRATV